MVTNETFTHISSYRGRYLHIDHSREGSARDLAWVIGHAFSTHRKLHQHFDIILKSNVGRSATANPISEKAGLIIRNIYSKLRQTTPAFDRADLQKGIKNNGSLYLACNDRNAFFFTSSDQSRYTRTLWSFQNVCDALSYLLDNTCIRFGTKLCRQIVGIPMSTNCAPRS